MSSARAGGAVRPRPASPGRLLAAAAARCGVLFWVWVGVSFVGLYLVRVVWIRGSPRRCEPGGLLRGGCDRCWPMQFLMTRAEGELRGGARGCCRWAICPYAPYRTALRGHSEPRRGTDESRGGGVCRPFRFRRRDEPLPVRVPKGYTRRMKRALDRSVSCPVGCAPTMPVMGR